MDPRLDDYAATRGAWPIYVRREHVEGAARGGRPVQVFPQDTVSPTALAERPRSGLTRETGYTGIPLVGGEIDLDANIRLTPTEWRGSYDQIGIVDRMVREDPVGAAIRMAWTLPLLSIPWLIEPASEDPKDREVADFVEAALFEHLRGGFESWLEQAVQFTWRGWALFEIVARFDKALQRTVIDRLAPRMPWTVYEWLRYRDGRWGAKQYAYSGDNYEDGGTPSGSRTPLLRPEKLLHLTYQPDGNNPEPMGILRPCYGAWRQRRTYLKLEATGFERAAYGIPYVEVDVGASPGDIEQVNIILRELRSGIRSFAMFPRGYTLKFAEFPMKAADIREARKSAGHDMARAALCQFLFTGEQAGAYSLIQGQLDHYTMALQQAGNRIAATLGQGPNAIIKRLVSWNFEGVDKFPTIQAGEVRVGDPKQLVEAIKTAVDAGALFPDAPVEAKVRAVLSLPARLESSAGGDLGPQEPEAGPEPPKASPPGGGEDSESGEEQEEQEREGREIESAGEPVAAPKRPWRKTAREFPATRLFADRIVQGPKGRGVRPIEGVIRFSETRGATANGGDSLGAVIAEWRMRVAREYAEKVSQAKTLPEAMAVVPPDAEGLRAALREGLEEAYRQGSQSVTNELERQREDPELREALESGEAYRTDDGTEPDPNFVPFSEGEHRCGQMELHLQEVKKPRSAPGMGPSPANVAPQAVLDGVAEATVLKEQMRLQAATGTGLQSAGIGGALPATAALRADAILAAVTGLSTGPEFLQASKDFKTIFGLGRVQEQRAEGIKEYMFSNLTESDTCYICEDLDGKTFGEEELNDYATPYWNCQGGDNCNCLVIGIV